MRFSPTQRQEIVLKIRQEMYSYHRTVLLPFGGGPVEKYCLYWGFFTVKALREAGCLEAQLQAGTAYWPLMGEEQDDGVSPNQYGYRFTWDRQAQVALVCGVQPEMHVWVAVCKPPVEIVDVTTPFFKKRAVEEGYRWPGEDPPDFFWHEGTDLPSGVTYLADSQAIEIAYSLLETAVRGTPLGIRYLRPLDD